MASFTNRPTLLGIQVLLLMDPYLINSGRFLDAWALFGTTVRLAYAIGLHRDPAYLSPAPPAHDAAVRRALWWSILQMDAVKSMTLGRPLGISTIGDCPAPSPAAGDLTALRLGEFTDHFTALARQMLSEERLSSMKIDHYSDALMATWETLPVHLKFRNSWRTAQGPIHVPPWPLDLVAAC